MKMAAWQDDSHFEFLFIWKRSDLVKLFNKLCHTPVQPIFPLFHLSPSATPPPTPTPLMKNRKSGYIGYRYFDEI